ncbi:MAG: hypothetical protein COB53_04735 [Elusimicrobia bacterium]|nr:MAG: hypothetical protein COB53_04735 [Elusimicrobiota bacterium]
MICPDCAHVNIDGADNCEECNTDLSAVCAAPQGLTKKIIEGTIADLQPRDAITVDPRQSIPDVIKLMREKKTGCILVVENGDVSGIMTERDLLFGVAGVKDPEDADMMALMHPDPVCLKEDDPVSFAFHHMSVGGFRHIPILRQSGTLGMISARDLLSYLSPPK